MAALRAFVRLLRWLGPWADPAKAPESPRISDVRLEPEVPGDRPLPLRIYRPARTRPIGSYLIAHGLSLLGPSDPRLDRFLRILADAGFVVYAPFLPDHIELRLRPEVARDLERALIYLLAHPERPQGSRPGIFSVSFGSYPALRVASAPRTRGLIGALIVFGGYADPDATIRFNIGVPVAGSPPAEPTSLAGVALNILDGFTDRPPEIGSVVAGWYEFARTTWGNPEFRDAQRARAVAEQIAVRMQPEQARFFLVGCGFAEGAQQACLRALERWGQQATVDPRPHLSGLRCPVYVFHSRLDDVIPCEESAKLLDALPRDVRARRYVTGLYEHTRRPPLSDLLRRVPAIAGEITTMLQMLAALVRGGRAS